MGTERGLYIEDMIRRKLRELRWGYVDSAVLDANCGIDGTLRSIAKRSLGVWLNMQYSFKLYDERKLEGFQQHHRQSRGPAAWLFVAFTDNGENTWPLINGYIAAVAGRFGASDPRRRWVYHLTLDENGRADWNDPAGQLRYLRRRHADGLYNQEARRAGIVIKLNGSALASSNKRAWMVPKADGSPTSPPSRMQAGTILFSEIGCGICRKNSGSAVFSL